MEKDGNDQDMVAALVGQWQKERPDLTEALWPVEVLARIQRMNRLIDKYLKAFTAEHGLEVGEFDVLSTLRRSGPPYALTAGALIPAAMVTSGAITNRIDRLEAKGLVERVRDGADRRSVRIRLTDAGRTLIDTVIEAHLRHYASLLAPLDRDTCEALAGSLGALLLAHGDTLAPPAAG
ncbi:MarR family transcriptional regulator [Streptomyces sp. W1SF4]|uniref:MarR family winged helix-turn-helix transcriptional regulator n=1 Tax=Streptomyces sp. W1SF4 TaxID=2305220 RepID=UPI000F701327|nr:MarR family transcriptional regulator [Streptomyces sp. W1SF4]AZM90725.1 MarR family transcriptional regulator [Streptomyces sp. W1SF4]